jgi:CubicO group peptidase (beta-lactamase class C family)
MNFKLLPPCAAILLAACSARQINLHSVVVERRGKIVSELYRSGPDKTMMKRYGMGNPFAADTVFDAETLHDVRSVSKSVTSLLYGIARDQNKVPPPEAVVLDHYPELADLRTPERARITFAHLLTMTSGLDWQEWGKGFITSDETPLLWKADTARYVLDRAQAAEPGTRFNYGGGSTAILADTITRGVGKPLAAFAESELFEPLGIKQWEWATDSQGRALAHAGLRLKPRDMVKIGRLILQKGRWNGKQIVSAAWIANSLQSHIKTGTDIFSGQGGELGYGYQWWQGQSPRAGRNVSWSAAVGNGGQRICVVPELDMVVVTTAGDYGEREIHKAVGKRIDEIIASAD